MIIQHPDAVYSDQYSGSKTKSSQYIHRIPYFTIVLRNKTKKEENDDELAGKLEVVKKRLVKFTMMYKHRLDLSFFSDFLTNRNSMKKQKI
jgi:hypothetical protein